MPGSGRTATARPNSPASTGRSTAFRASASQPSERRPLTIEDRALFIYTSGTTGLPKAANINHYRLMLASHGFAGAMNTQPTDRIYVCLPMYHTTGGVCAIGSVLVHGGSAAIRERFSGREFWDDLVRFDCTLFQYIGELCRYLVNSPPNPSETKHRIRLACGNGLRPDVWPEFQKRFAIPHILEFYAATEGNVDHVQFRRATRAPSGAFPGSSPIASRPRSCASTSARSSRSATTRASAFRASRTRSAR